METAAILNHQDFGIGGIQEIEDYAVIQKITTPLETVTTEILLVDQLSTLLKDSLNQKVLLSWATQELGK